MSLDFLAPMSHNTEVEGQRPNKVTGRNARDTQIARLHWSVRPDSKPEKFSEVTQYIRRYDGAYRTIPSDCTEYPRHARVCVQRIEGYVRRVAGSEIPR